MDYLTGYAIIPSGSLSFAPGADLSRIPMTPELQALIAERFKALSDTARLQILNALRSGEKSVTELIDETGLGHRSRDIFQLCDVMCGRIERVVRARRRLLAS